MPNFNVELRSPEGKKGDFLGASAIFSISLGKTVLMTGDCLRRTIELINPIFQNCDIVISDTLQRFNILMEHPLLSLNAANRLALRTGDEWLRKNLHTLSQLNIPHTITRWNDWLQHPDFQEKLNFVTHLLSKDPRFADAILEAGKKYFQRQMKTFDATTSEYGLTLKFILEEAAIMLLWCDAGYAFELHPSSRNAALVHVHRIYFQNKNNMPNLRQARIKVLGDLVHVKFNEALV